MVALIASLFVEEFEILKNETLVSLCKFRKLRERFSRFQRLHYLYFLAGDLINGFFVTAVRLDFFRYC